MEAVAKQPQSDIVKQNRICLTMRNQTLPGSTPQSDSLWFHNTVMIRNESQTVQTCQSVRLFSGDFHLSEFPTGFLPECGLILHLLHVATVYQLKCDSYKKDAHNSDKHKPLRFCVFSFETERLFWDAGKDLALWMHPQRSCWVL